MAAPVIVLGSANIDLTVVVERHPLPGETVLGGDLTSSTGGKGANQALAVARAGVRPVFLGAVGDDAGGRAILDALELGGVDSSRALVAAGTPTGAALITVSESGENSIVVAPGANATLSASRVSPLALELIDASTVLLAQLEVPVDAVQDVAEKVAGSGGRVVLNLSPYRPVPDSLLALCDPLIVNSTEAAGLAGMPVKDTASAALAATALLKRSRSVVITLGAEGAVFAARARADQSPEPPLTGLVAAPRVPVIDTTGAGDSFAGALAAALSQGSTVDVAVERGIEAGAQAVQWAGAQPPVPVSDSERS